jgi:hypothetical protein
MEPELGCRAWLSAGSRQEGFAGSPGKKECWLGANWCKGETGAKHDLASTSTVKSGVPVIRDPVPGVETRLLPFAFPCATRCAAAIIRADTQWKFSS